MIVWIDSEDGRRGGSIYIRGLHVDLIARGVKSRYESVKSLRQRIFLILMTWISDDEIRGTVPQEIPTMMFSRRKCGYIQSPMEEWSLLSRIGLGILVGLSGDTCRLVSVSRTTQRSAEENGFQSLDVEYAKLGTRNTSSREKVDNIMSKELVLIIMDNQLIDKGYLRHLSIVEAVEANYEVIVEVYGRRGGGRYTHRGKTHYNGFKEDPFQDALKRNKGKRVVYLGCSRVEGLHLAVVEAAIAGIPSILSDIPAHRELEEVAGWPLWIGGDVNENIVMLRRLVQKDEYYREARRCEYLANNFRVLSMMDRGN